MTAHRFLLALRTALLAALLFAALAVVLATVTVAAVALARDDAHHPVPGASP